MKYRKKLSWSALSPAQKADLRQRKSDNLAGGCYNHSKPPFGYKFVQNKQGFREIAPVPALSKIVKDVYEGIAYADLNSMRELADYLTARLNKKFTRSLAIKFIQNTANMGWYELPASLGGGFRKATNFKATHVSETLFKEAVCRTLQEAW